MDDAHASAMAKSSSFHLRALFLAAAAVAAIATALILVGVLRDDGRFPEGVPPATAQPAAVIENLRLADVPEREAAAGPELTPSERCLSDFWGKDWPQVKAGMEAAGFEYANLPPVTVSWESAAAEIEKRLEFTAEERAQYKLDFTRWGDVEDSRWMITRYGSRARVDADSLARVHAEAEAQFPEVEQLSEEILDDLANEVRSAWAQGRYARGLYTTHGAPGFDPQRKIFYGKSDGHEGWGISMSFAWSDVPHIEAKKQEIDRHIRNRDNFVREQFDALNASSNPK